jgi:ribonuclease T
LQIKPKYNAWMTDHEFFISVDVETSGPNPGQYALLSIGACAVTTPDLTFYVELKPDYPASLPEALQISGFSMQTLMEHGLPPAIAMGNFADWVADLTPPDHRPVFVAFNAPFDWMFVNDYFYRYLGHNPFGHSALDIKAFYMGLRGVPWGKTGMQAVSETLLGKRALSHHALQDALDQAELFRKMLAEAQAKNR